MKKKGDRSKAFKLLVLLEQGDVMLSYRMWVCSDTLYMVVFLYKLLIISHHFNGLHFKIWNLILCPSNKIATMGGGYLY